MEIVVFLYFCIKLCIIQAHNSNDIINLYFTDSENCEQYYTGLCGGVCVSKKPAKKFCTRAATKASSTTNFQFSSVYTTVKTVEGTSFVYGFYGLQWNNTHSAQQRQVLFHGNIRKPLKSQEQTMYPILSLPWKKYSHR